MRIEPVHPYPRPELPQKPPSNSVELSWADSWVNTHDKSGTKWPYLDPFADPSDCESAHPYIIGAGQSIFQKTSPDAGSNQALLSGMLIGDSRHLDNATLDYGRWRAEQAVREGMNAWPPTLTTETLQQGLDFAENLADTGFGARLNDYGVSLADRVVSGGGGFGGDTTAGVGNVALNIFNATLNQYALAGLPPNVMLQNAINYRNLLVKKGGNPKVIASFNKEIAEMGLDLRRHGEY